MTHKQRRSRFALALGSVLVFFSLLELGLRLARLERHLPAPREDSFRFYPMLATDQGNLPLDHYQGPTERDGRRLQRVENLSVPDPELLYRLRPNAIWEKHGWTIVTNSLGLRDREPVRPKPAGETRILCLGDSVTFGWLLEEEDTWPRRLEERLAVSSGASRFRVMNAGVYGYTTTQALGMLRKKLLLELEADRAILAFGLNDATGLGRALTDSLARPPGAARHLLARSSIYRTLRALLVPLRDRLLRSHGAVASLRIYRRNLQEMIRLLRAQRMECVLLGEAVVEGAGWKRLQKLPEYVDVARELAREEQIPFLDMGEVFCPHVRVLGRTDCGAGNPRELFVDACHPNPQGALLMAEAIHELLAETWFSGRTPPPASTPETTPIGVAP